MIAFLKAEVLFSLLYVVWCNLIRSAAICETANYVRVSRFDGEGEIDFEHVCPLTTDHARLNKCILPEIQMCYQAHVLCVKPEQKSSNEHVSGQYMSSPTISPPRH